MISVVDYATITPPIHAVGTMTETMKYSSRKLNVALSALWFPLTMASYFVRAFERRADVELWTCGPYTGNWIPWTDRDHPNGITTPMKYLKVPDFALPSQAISTIPSAKIIEGKLPWTPDLFIQIDAGWHFATRPPGTVVALVETDPHVLKGNYQLPKSYSDITFCMQKCYIGEGEFYLPYAFDPTVHYPEEREKVYDACLVGLLYDHRQRLITHLKNKGLSVYYGIGEIYDEYRMRYNQSKIALSWSSLQDTPARAWEALGMKVPLLTNRTPDLASFFVEEEHYFGFDTVEEAYGQARRILDDPEMASHVADAAYRKVKVAHSYDHRVNQILETCKLI
jgi:hypothetical protein